MKGIVIGAGPESVYSINKAKEYGVIVYAIDGNPSALGLSHADYAETLDISNVDLVFEFVKKHNIDFVIPVAIGRLLTTIGKVNDRFGFKGISYKGALNSVDKFRFHAILSSKNLRNTESYLFDGNIKNTKYPVIAKPRFGSGSKGVEEFATREGVLDYLKDADTDFIIEEKFIGEEIGVDCQMIDGVFNIVLLRMKKNTPPPFMQAISYSSALDIDYNGDLHADLQHKLEDAVKAMELNDCLIHVDVLVSKDELFIVELSGRPSGHHLHNKFTIYATGYDMIDNYINYQVNGQSTFNVESNNCGIYYFNLKPGVVKSIPGEKDFSQTLEYELNIQVNDVIENITNGPQLMSRGYFILEGCSQQDLESKSNKILELFDIE